MALLLGILPGILAIGCKAKTPAKSGAAAGPILIGLITKTDSNPYFVKLREAAKAQADKDGAELIALAGEFDGDNEGQVAAIENMVGQGVKGILITPNSSTGVLDAIKKARDAGVVVIALDTATDPEDAVDATFATDNKAAGRQPGQVGQGRTRRRGAPGRDARRHPRRHRRHLPSRRIPRGLRHQRTTRRRSSARRTPTATRPRRRPRWRTSSSAPRASTRSTPSTSRRPPVRTRRSRPGTAHGQITIGSIDGSCTGVADVKAGKIGATVMQFPAKMAEQGVQAVVKFAKDGTKPSGFNDTGSQLVTDKPVPASSRKDTAWGRRTAGLTAGRP